jgi:hypothetical protein
MSTENICAPTWAGVLPLLIYTIATSSESDAGAEAVAQLQRLSDALDAWNARVPVLLGVLHEALDATRDEEHRMASENILRALALVAGDK